MTEIEDDEGVLTGRVRGPILWGPGKADAVRAFAEEQGLDLGRVLRVRQRRRGRALPRDGRPTAPAEPGRPAHPGRRAAWLADPPADPAPPAHAAERRALRGVVRRPRCRRGGRPRAWALLNRDRSTALAVASAGGVGALARRGRRLARGASAQENLWKARPAVFVFNHQSQLDVAILAALLRRDFTGVAKKELAKDPTFARDGLAGRRGVRRPVGRAGRPGRARPGRRQPARWHVAGDRARGHPLPDVEAAARSRRAPFHLAMQAGVPMVPIVIRNAGEIMPPHSLLISAGTVHVAVLPPVATDPVDRQEPQPPGRPGPPDVPRHAGRLARVGPEGGVGRNPRFSGETGTYGGSIGQEVPDSPLKRGIWPPPHQQNSCVGRGASSVVTC